MEMAAGGQQGMGCDTEGQVMPTFFGFGQESDWELLLAINPRWQPRTSKAAEKRGRELVFLFHYSCFNSPAFTLIA